MRRFAPIAILMLALALPAAAGATATTAPLLTNVTDVTSTHAVQRDLRLASEYWAIEQPTLQSPCVANQVIVTGMIDGVGDNGQIIPASDVWAETELGGCTIDVAPIAWATGTSGNSNTTFMMCVLIAHEYGHTLGLPDSEGVPMMSNNWSRRDDPLCDRSVYGWKWTLHKDREWIAANRRPLRMARREALRQQVRAAEVTAAANSTSPMPQAPDPTTSGASAPTDQPVTPPSVPTPTPPPSSGSTGSTGSSGATGATGATGSSS
ncbi:MAG TPA: hypothetical protein VGG41_05610 [Solirubrobacteraceae bacterium]|jgi:hypothetical protein